MYKIRDFGLALKAVANDGTFSGYGSVFGVVDSFNELVSPGAFKASLASRSHPVPVLWQHRQDEPIGVYTSIAEDDRGLYVEGKLLTSEVAKAKEAYALLKAGAVSGLSIGYFVRGSSYDEKTGIRTLTALDLEEVSIVTTPANGEARVETVKSLLAKGGVPTIRDLETILRDAGFSRSQAISIAKHGYGGLRDADEANNYDLSALIAQVSSFKLS